MHKRLKIALAALSLPIIAEHEQILARSWLFFITDPIFEVLADQSLDLLMEVKFAFHFFFNIVELELMLAVNNFLGKEFFDLVL